MAIEIKITADSPEELLKYMDALWSIGGRDATGSIAPSAPRDYIGPSIDEIIAKAAKDVTPNPETNTFIAKAVADAEANKADDEAREAAQAKRGRGRPKKDTTPAETAASDEAGPANDETMTAAQAEAYAGTSQTETPATLDACKDALRHVTDNYSYDDGRALLAKFNTPRVSLLDPKLYAEFIATAKSWTGIRTEAD